MADLDNPIVPTYPPPALRKSLDAETWKLCLASWCELTEYFIHRSQTSEKKGLIGATHFLRFLASFVSLSRDDDGVLRVDDPDDESSLYQRLELDVFTLLSEEYAHSSVISNMEMFWGFTRLYSQTHSHKVILLVKSLACDNHTRDKIHECLIQRICKKGGFKLKELNTLRVIFKDKQIVQSWVTISFIKHLQSIVGTAMHDVSTDDIPSPAEAALKIVYISLTELVQSDTAATVQILRTLITQLPPPAEVLPIELLPSLLVRHNFIAKLQQIPSDDSGLEGIIISLETIRGRIPHDVIREIKTIFRKKPRKRIAKTGNAHIHKDSGILSILSEDDARKVREISDINPDLSVENIIQLLADHHGSVADALSFLSERKPVTDVKEKEETRIFDTLDFAPGTIHIGKKPRENADEMLHHTTSASEKQKIFDTLALIYDEDEADERDDTYDDLEAGVYETPLDDDEGIPNPEKQRKQNNTVEDPTEKLLWELYSTRVGAFDIKGRGSKERNDLKSQTRWSDEQIEGWAKMLARDVSTLSFSLEASIDANNLVVSGQDEKEAGESIYVQREPQRILYRSTNI